MLLLTLILLLWPLSTSAETPYNTLIRGKLDRVVDGDTIRIEGHKEAFRLYGIDATELKQECLQRKNGLDQPIAYGELVTDFLKSKILHNHINTLITCDFNKRGHYNRPLAVCYSKNQIYSDINLNKLMVFSGRAFADRKYAKDPEYITLEEIAKRNQWGMWHGRIKCQKPSEFRNSSNKQQTE